MENYMWCVEGEHKEAYAMGGGIRIKRSLGGSDRDGAGR